MEQNVYDQQCLDVDLDILSLTNWFESLFGKELEKPFIDLISDGVLLCKIVNVLKPGVIRIIHHNPTNIAKKMENIGFFINACHRRFEVPKSLLFDPANVQYLSSTATLNPTQVAALRSVVSILMTLRRDYERIPSKAVEKQEKIENKKTETVSIIGLQPQISEFCTQSAIIEELLTVIHSELGCKQQEVLANKILDNVDKFQKQLLCLSDSEIKDFALKAGLKCSSDETRAQCIDKILMLTELI